MSTPGKRAREWMDQELEFTKGAGILLLTLGEALVIFALWILLWPSAIGVTGGSVATAIVALLLTVGAVGVFYTGYVAVSQRIGPAVEAEELD